MQYSFITAESFPYQHIDFPTPRGIANIYFDPKEVQKPLYATMGWNYKITKQRNYNNYMLLKQTNIKFKETKKYLHC